MITAFLCMTLLQLPAQSPRPAVTAQPYNVTVCLRTADNPMLTPLYVSSVARQVNDQLASYFGPLARVRVVTADHWLLDDYPHSSAAEPKLTAVDLARQETQEKAFVVYLDYREGKYQVESRLIDTMNDQVSPLRRRATPDRWWVSKSICLATKESFSISAEVTPGEIAGTASLWFQGEVNREQLLSVMGERCILQPLWVIRHGSGQVQRRPIPRTLLVWDSQGPMHSAKVVTNNSNPWPQRALISGFEAVKLDTRSGRLRLRILDSTTGEPVLNCSVSVGDTDFESLNDNGPLYRPNRLGYVVTRRSFEHIAYVRVSQGSSVAKVPVAITEEVTDCVIRISSDNAISVKNEFARALRFLVQDLQTIGAVQSRAVAEFNKLNAEKRYEEALAKVKSAIGFIDPRLSNAQASFGSLQGEAETLNMTTDAFYQVAVSQMGEAKQRQQELSGLQESIKTAIETRDAQQRADVLIKLAKQAERIGDLDEAIAKYDLALAEQPNQPQLQQHLSQLKDDWKVKSDSHGQARTFIDQQWAQAEVTQIEPLLPQALAAFDTLVSHRDQLAARRLVHVNDALIGELTALIGQLEQRGGEADAAELKQYADVVERMSEFQSQIAQFMSQPAASAPSGPAPPSTPAGSPPPTTSSNTDSNNADDGTLLDLDLNETEEEPLSP